MIIHKNTWTWGQTHTIVFKCGVGLVSVSIYNEEPDVAWIHGVSVIEDYRRQGIGTRILQLAEEEAVKMGAHTVKLSTLRESFMEDWYKKSGYEVIGEEDDVMDILLKKLR